LKPRRQTKVALRSDEVRRRRERQTDRPDELRRVEADQRLV
jgi:hypothetical protein